MAKTLTEQAHLPPVSGATLFTDGDPLAAHMGHDWPRMINNLWACVDMDAIYLQHPVGHHNTDVTGSLREIYVDQTIVPVRPGVARMKWTVGLQARSTGGTTTIRAVSLYLASKAYTGVGDPFDVGQVGAGFSYSSVSSPLAISATVGGGGGAATSAYNFVAGADLTDFNGTFVDSDDRLAHLILTVTAEGDGGVSFFNFAWINDLTVWFLRS